MYLHHKNDNPLDNATFQFLLQFVSPKKLERILRQRVKQNADNMLVGTILAKYMLLKVFHIPFSAQHTSYGPYGKPYLRDYPNVYFNISHSYQFVACAVSDHPIGIDIQQIIPYRFDIAKRVCTSEELLRVETSPDPSAEFTKLWTQKEAYLKMLGVGISEGFLNEKLPANFETYTQTIRFMNTFVSIWQ